jgi:hypothetical protein
MRACLGDKVPCMARRVSGVEQHPVVTGGTEDVLVTVRK